MEFESLSVTGDVKRKVKRRPFCTRTPSGCCKVPRANRLEVCRARGLPSTVIALKVNWK
jgi:hypothetical protein